MTDDTTKTGSRRRRIIGLAAAGGVLVLALGTGGGVAIAQSITHDDALAEARTATEEATTARQTAADARRMLGLAAARVQGEVDTLEQLDSAKLTAVVGAEVVDELQASVAAANEALTDAAERVPASVAAVPTVDARMSLNDLEAATTTAREIQAAWEAENVAFGDVILTLEAATGKIDDSVKSAAEKAPDGAAAVLAASPLADEPSKVAVTEAAAALTDADDAAGGLAAFLDAVDAVKASHAAEEARRAEEAARAAQGSSGRSGSGSRGGNGSAGGGGGVPSTGGGGAPGGGTTPPADTRRYADPRGPYTPGCPLGGLLYSHDPGPGGTSVIASVSIPYDYRISGNNVLVYVCQ